MVTAWLRTGVYIPVGSSTSRVVNHKVNQIVILVHSTLHQHDINGEGERLEESKYLDHSRSVYTTKSGGGRERGSELGEYLGEFTYVKYEHIRYIKKPGSGKETSGK